MLMTEIDTWGVSSWAKAVCPFSAGPGLLEEIE